MPTTSRGFRYPAASDTPDVPRDLGYLAADVDAQYISGTAGTRPAFGVVGRKHYATDTGELSLDIGTAWVRVGGSNTLRSTDVGVSVQGYDADLAAIAALATTSTGRDLLTAADAAAIRTKAGTPTYSPEATVTSLPGSPVDGQEVYYLADSANGVVWHLKYRSAGTTYKWEYVGGSALYSAPGMVGSPGGVGGTGYTTMGSAPSIAVPIAGSYECYLQCGVMNDGGSSTSMLKVSYTRGGTGAVDGDGVTRNVKNDGSGTGDKYQEHLFRRRRTTYTAVTHTMQVAHSGSYGYFGYGLEAALMFTPVKIG